MRLGLAELGHREIKVDDLGSTLPSLMYFAVLPYAGHEAAADELRVAVSR